MKILICENANPAGLFRVGPNFFPLGGFRSRLGIKLDLTYEIGQKLRSRWPRLSELIRPIELVHSEVCLLRFDT